MDRDVQFLKKENDRLRELIGSWRRKAQDKHSRRKCLSEGFDGYSNRHYKVYVVKDIPGDLPIKEVLKELKKGFLQEVKPYRFSKCDYSERYDAWLVKVTNWLDIYMYDDNL